MNSIRPKLGDMPKAANFVGVMEEAATTGMVVNIRIDLITGKLTVRPVKITDLPGDLADAQFRADGTYIKMKYVAEEEK